MKRPTEGANEGKTPALSNEQAKRMLSAPPEPYVSTYCPSKAFEIEQF